MDKNNNIYIKTGFTISALCVLLGAFASHFLKEILDPADLVTFETGTRYMFYHAMAISFISLSHRKFHQNVLDLSVFLFLGGMAFFTGSLYLLATRTIWGDESDIWIGAITPVGGVLFIAGWIMLITRGLKGDENETSDNKSKVSKHKHRKNRKESNTEMKNTEAIIEVNTVK